MSTTNVGPINNLPKDILLEIFSHLPIAGLAKTSQVCKKWKEVSDNKKLWEAQLQKMSIIKIPSSISEKGAKFCVAYCVKCVECLSSMEPNKTNSMLGLLKNNKSISEFEFNSQEVLDKALEIIVTNYFKTTPSCTLIIEISLPNHPDAKCQISINPPESLMKKFKNEQIVKRIKCTGDLETSLIGTNNYKGVLGFFVNNQIFKLCVLFNNMPDSTSTIMDKFIFRNGRHL